MASRKKPEAKQPPRAQKAPGLQPRKGAPPALTVACLAIVALAAIIPYSNSLNGELFSDNMLIIRQSPLVTNPANFGKIFMSNYWAGQDAQTLYRPLAILTYRLQRIELGAGDNPIPYHAFNLVLHALNALLVFLVLLQLIRLAGKFGEEKFNVLFAAFGGVLFAAHPITTEGVTNIVGRADQLVMFFLLGALLLHITGTRKSGGAAAIYYTAAAGCTFLALLSKENAIAAVVIFAAFDLLFLLPAQMGREKRPFVRWAFERVKACYWMYGLAVALWFGIRHIALRDLTTIRPAYVDNPLAYLPFLQREATAVVMQGLYLFRMAWPVTLSGDYSPEQIPPVASIGDWRFLASMAALAAIAAVAILAWKKSPIITFLVLFFYLTIFPVSNIALVIGTIGAERLLYVPSFGWAGMLALGAAYLACAFSRKLGNAAPAAACVLVAAIAALYGWRTIERNNDYCDELTFWRITATETSPQSVRALQGYAVSLEKTGGDLNVARAAMEKALSLTDRSISAYAALGDIYYAMAKKASDKGDNGAMEQCLNHAYEIVKKGVALDLKRQAEIRGEIDVSRFKLTAPALGNQELHLAVAKICFMRAQFYLLVRPNQKECEAAIEEAYASARQAVLKDCFKSDINMQYGQILVLKAQLRTGQEREKLLEEAAVAFIRGILFIQYAEPGIYEAIWKELTECYRMLGYDAMMLLPMSGGVYNFEVKKDKEGINIKFKARAFRSLILLARSSLLLIMTEVDMKEQIDKFVTLAGKYKVPHHMLDSALTGPVSLDDPRVLTGE